MYHFVAFLSLTVHGFSELLLFKSSVVGTVTRYGLDCPGTKCGEREIFCTYPDQLWCPPSLLYNWYQVVPRGKAAGAWHRAPSPT